MFAASTIGSAHTRLGIRMGRQFSMCACPWWNAFLKDRKRDDAIYPASIWCFLRLFSLKDEYKLGKSKCFSFGPHVSFLLQGLNCTTAENAFPICKYNSRGDRSRESEITTFQNLLLCPSLLFSPPKLILVRPRWDSNPQSPAPEADALSIRPLGYHSLSMYLFLFFLVHLIQTHMSPICFFQMFKYIRKLIKSSFPKALLSEIPSPIPKVTSCR